MTKMIDSSDVRFSIQNGGWYPCRTCISLNSCKPCDVFAACKPCKEKLPPFFETYIPVLEKQIR